MRALALIVAATVAILSVSAGTADEPAQAAPQPDRESTMVALPRPDDLVSFGGHRYALVDEVEGLSWNGAREQCSEWGGHLAVVTDADEAAFVAELCDGRYAFLGASDAETEGEWRWVDGSTWEFTNWMSGQPNDYGGSEDYLATYSDGEWVDVEASGTDFWMPTGFVCEWDD